MSTGHLSHVTMAAKLTCNVVQSGDPLPMVVQQRSPLETYCNFAWNPRPFFKEGHSNKTKNKRPYCDKLSVGECLSCVFANSSKTAGYLLRYLGLRRARSFSTGYMFQRLCGPMQSLVIVLVVVCHCV